MALIVKKFGGSSVATPEKIFNIVDRVLREKKEDDKVVIVVSAMGDTTDDLVSLAKEVTSKPYGREMDRLLSTGEQVTIALMAMAFNERGQKYGGGRFCIDQSGSYEVFRGHTGGNRT